nr:hypothetical protein [uncultured Limnohabitans sp.]
MKSSDGGCIDPLLNFPKLMTGLTMLSKPLPSTASWPKAIVSPEEIDALLHGIFPLILSPLIANPCEPAGLGACHGRILASNARALQKFQLV